MIPSRRPPFTPPPPAASAADAGPSSSNLVAGNRGPNSAVAQASTATAWHLPHVGMVMVPPRLLTQADAAFPDAEIRSLLTLLSQAAAQGCYVQLGEEGGHKIHYLFSGGSHVGPSSIATLCLDRDHWLRELLLEKQEANGNTTRHAVQFQPRSSATLPPRAPSLPDGSPSGAAVAGRKRQSSPPPAPNASRLRTEANIRHVLGLEPSSRARSAPLSASAAEMPPPHDASSMAPQDIIRERDRSHPGTAAERPPEEEWAGSFPQLAETQWRAVPGESGYWPSAPSSQWDGNRGEQPASPPSQSFFAGAFDPWPTSPVPLTPRGGGEPTVPAGTSNLPQRSGIQYHSRIQGVPSADKELIDQYKKNIPNQKSQGRHAAALRTLASWLASHKVYGSDKGYGLAQLAKLDATNAKKILEDCVRAHPDKTSLDATLKAAFKTFQEWRATGNVSFVAHPRIQGVPSADKDLIKEYKINISHPGTQKNHATALSTLASWLALNKGYGLAQLAERDATDAEKIVQECVLAHSNKKNIKNSLNAAFQPFQQWRVSSRPAPSPSFWSAADREIATLAQSGNQSELQDDASYGEGQEITGHGASGAGPRSPFAIPSRPRYSFSEEVVGFQWQHSRQVAPDNLVGAFSRFGIEPGTRINILGQPYLVNERPDKMVPPTQNNPLGRYFVLDPVYQGG